MNPNDEMLGATLGIVKLPPAIPDDRGGIAVWIMTLVEWVCLHQATSAPCGTAEPSLLENGRPTPQRADTTVLSGTTKTN